MGDRRPNLMRRSGLAGQEGFACVERGHGAVGQGSRGGDELIFGPATAGIGPKGVALRSKGAILYVSVRDAEIEIAAMGDSRRPVFGLACRRFYPGGIRTGAGERFDSQFRVDKFRLAAE